VQALKGFSLLLLKVVLALGRVALKCMTCTNTCTIGHNHGKEKVGPQKPDCSE